MSPILVDKNNTIYAITPDMPINLNSIQSVLAQGVCFLQYRRKINNPSLKKQEASLLKQLCSQYHTPLIINDDIELCSQIDAHGVHLGSNDISLKKARVYLGNDKIIGVSCYNQLSLAQEAQDLGADYVAFGRLFASKTKPNSPRCLLKTITHAKGVLSIPIVGIGGITMENKALAQQAGCDMVAMIEALFPTPLKKINQIK